MKTVPLPKQLDLRGLAARGAEVTGTVSSEDLPRLTSAGVRLADLAQVSLRLSKDEAGRAVVDAQIKATVVLQCQRCLQGMTWPLTTSTLMACVWRDEEAAMLPTRYEPLLVEEDANLRDIVEEELLLALPPFPLHENDCKTAEQLAALVRPEEVESDMSDDAKKQNPFGVLEQLKNSLSKVTDTLK